MVDEEFHFNLIIIIRKITEKFIKLIRNVKKPSIYEHNVHKLITVLFRRSAHFEFPDQLID